MIGSLNVGGAERHVAQILPRLDRKRWKPIVFCLTERGALADGLEAQGVPVLASSVDPPLKGASRVRRTLRIAQATVNLAGVMRRLSPAVAHFFLPAAYILGAPAALLAGVPIRVMSRRSLNDYQKNHPVSAFVERRLHATMSAVLGNSLRVVEQLEMLEQVPREKLGLIYNGVNRTRTSEETRSRMRSSLGIASEALVFIIVANLIPYKGHSDLIEAFARAAPRLGIGWRVLIVGRDDGIGVDLNAQVKSAGIEANVSFLGVRHDISDLLAASDVNLLSSHQEGFSNAVLEGMAAGLPSIVTDVGGNPEAVVDGESGFVVPCRDPVRFSEAIKRLASDAGLRAAMGSSALARAEGNFTIEACVERYEDLYASLVAGRRPCEIDGVRIG